MLNVIITDEVARTALHERPQLFRTELAGRRIIIKGNQYIACVVLGADGAAVEVASRLQESAFDVRAIRPPTVPDNTARLRISIHADHEPVVLKQLADLLCDHVAKRTE